MSSQISVAPLLEEIGPKSLLKSKDSPSVISIIEVRNSSWPKNNPISTLALGDLYLDIINFSLRVNLFFSFSKSKPKDASPIFPVT